VADVRHRRIALALLVVLVTASTGVGSALVDRVSTPPDESVVAGATTTTTAPPATAVATSAALPSYDCTNPTFNTSSHDGGTAYGSYYVTNNMWNPLSVTQTLYTCDYDSWYVESTMTSRGGAVQTYPNSQMTFGNRPKLRALESLTSSFAESTEPSGNGYDYEYAYDIWINGYGGTGYSELMIWNYNDGQTASGTDEGTFRDGGHTYAVHLAGTAASGDYIAFVATSNFTSGTINLVHFFRYAISRGWIERGPSAKLWQVDYGVEICSTGGHRATFAFTDFDVDPVYTT
jgi:hypothetical protein